MPTGLPVKAGDVVFEIDPADQEFALQQAKSELAEAEQQIVKIKADSAVQAAEDQVALLTARYDVRRGELNTAANDLIGAIDAKKNILTLEEARHRLEQLELDVKSRSATNQAGWRSSLEQRNKARLAMERAKSIIDSLVVKAPFDGVVSAKENRDAAGGFFYGQRFRSIAQGDTTFAGARSPTSSNRARWRSAPRSTRPTATTFRAARQPSSIQMRCRDSRSRRLSARSADWPRAAASSRPRPSGSST